MSPTSTGTQTPKPGPSLPPVLPHGATPLKRCGHARDRTIKLHARNVLAPAAAAAPFASASPAAAFASPSPAAARAKAGF